MKINSKIQEDFIEIILKGYFPNQYKEIYQESILLQYLDLKSKAIHGNSKSRRALANIYAIYSLLYFYIEEGYCEHPNQYKNFQGFEYTKLFNFYRKLYGGEKLQNHALNSRVNGEIQTKFNTNKVLIFRNNSKYLIPINFLLVKDQDISKACVSIIKEYINILKQKDITLMKTLKNLKNNVNYNKKINILTMLLTEDSEARIFEIISYAVLKNHYKNIKIFIGYTKEDINEHVLMLYKTGRTNANDGGIDFVMRPLGRFFQVTEVGNYDKYFLDIDKVMHYPITFVIKTNKKIAEIKKEFDEYINEKSGGMTIIIDRYKKAIEEIITINELLAWLKELKNSQINDVINDIIQYYSLEMNLFQV